MRKLSIFMFCLSFIYATTAGADADALGELANLSANAPAQEAPKVPASKTAEKTTENAELLELYINKGIAAVQARLEEGLSDANLWRKLLASKDLRYGYYQRDKILIVVDKSEQKLQAYAYTAGKLSQKFEQKVITGLMGDKLREGDLKTPVGAYEILRKMTPPDIYYGPWAFVLSYPSAYDSSLGRTGSGIWIHGFPLDGDVRYDAYKTKGCVVMTNDLLLDFEGIMGEQSGEVMINEKGQAQTNADEISLILAGLFEWKAAWANNDIKKYLSFYDESFKRPNGSDFKSFAANKTAIFARGQSKEIAFKNIEITPYPNTQNIKMFKVKFYEDYVTQTYNFHGNKALYLKLVNNSFKILSED